MVQHRKRGRTAAPWPPRRLVAAVLAFGLAVTSCAGGAGTGSQQVPPAPPLNAEIVQLRRDQVLERVEVALENRGPAEVIVESLLVRVPGFDAGGAVPKESRIPPTNVVNLPWPYGTVRCGETSAPTVGPATVALRVHTATDPTSRPVQLVAADPDGLLQSIADRTCTVERLRREIDLRWGDRWRAEQTADGVVIHGTLEARLLAPEPKAITDMAGAIMYGMRPDTSAGPVPDPLAELTSQRPQAAIPVEAYASRCDGHTIGEIKKPYEFLVWVSSPGEEPVALTPDVGQPTKDALRKVCAF